MTILRSTAALLLIILAGCPQVGYLWIEEGSTVSHLVLVAGHKPGREGRVFVSSLTLEKCDTDRFRPVYIWHAERGVNVPPDVTRFEYGVIPEGWEQRGPAPALEPGCYRARIHTSPGTVEFDLDSTGVITERPLTPKGPT